MATAERNTSETVLVPAILTNSGRVILDSFAGQIVKLTAHASVETRNEGHIEELRQYGVTRVEETHHGLAINYERLETPDGAKNPLTNEVCDQIYDEIDASLDASDRRVTPDLAVQSMTVRVTEPALREVIDSAQSDTFDLVFRADPAEAAYRDHTRRRNDDALYSEFGFNLTNLNLRRVTERAAELHQQSNPHHMRWKGNKRKSAPRSPKRLAIRINQHVLPDEYGTLKPFEVLDDTIVDVPEDVAHDLLNGEIQTDDDGTDLTTGGEN